MMAALYFLFFIALGLIVAGQRNGALVFSVFALLLGVAMVFYHMTGPLKILL